ncbi:hypothetical protein [Nitrosomonas sp.]|uniref:hypothetical protein n=1 Tax=Nitrosomonas sp. TaxID=42353 RepID=UPI0025E308F4|nr:hypothetical protein [Nitrosomonas sp.]MBY0483462.1 hypothetical protein [Nitrosomonas sp.]
MNENDIDKRYLLLLNTSTVQPEHAKIQTTLSKLSNDTSKPIYFDKHGGAFLFVTKLNAGQISARLEGILLNDDNYIIVEVGSDWFTFGNTKAATWFQKYINR